MPSNHKVKAQLEFAASEEASAGLGSAPAGSSSASGSASNGAYAAPLPLASYSG